LLNKEIKKADTKITPIIERLIGALLAISELNGPIYPSLSSKPGIKSLKIYKKTHEIKKLNTPNVMKLRGKVKKPIIGLIAIWQIERTTASIKIAVNVSISKPVIALSTIKSIEIYVKILRMSFFIR
jgi:hypothetical protein